MRTPTIISVLLATTVFALSSTGVAAESDLDDGATGKPSKRKGKKSSNKGVVLKLDKVQVESGTFLNSAAPDTFNYAHVAASLNWQPSRQRR